MPKDDEKENGVLQPLRTTVPKESIPLDKAGQKIRENGVGVLAVGNGRHYNKGVADASNHLVSGFNPDLYFTEDSRDLPKTEIAALRQEHFPTLPATAEMIGADWNKAKKDALLVDARISQAGPEAVKLAKKHSPKESDFAKTQDGELNYRLATISNDGLVKILENDQKGHEAYKIRTSRESDYEVATYIVDKIEAFYKKNDRMPAVAISYGIGHFSDTDGIDELVNFELRKRSLPEVKFASVGIDEAKSAGNKLEYTGRGKDGSGFDYKVRVSDKAPKFDTYLGSAISEKILPPALVLASIDANTTMNTVIEAFNQIDNAAALTPEVEFIFSKYKYQNNEDIKLMGKGELAGNYFDEAGIKVLNEFGANMVKEASQAVFDRDKSGRLAGGLKNIDSTFDALKSGLEQLPSTTERSK